MMIWKIERKRSLNCWRKTLRKILLSLAVSCLLFSCARKEVSEVPSEEKEEFIDPVKDVFIFGEIEPELRKRLKLANCHSDMNNYQFAMLEREAYGTGLTDIEGNDISLKELGDFFLEVVSVNCSHCKKQLHVLSSLVEEKNIPFVQYFNVGNREEILEMYEKEGVELPENTIIIAEDDGMKEYVNRVLKMKSYPTLLTYKEGKISFDALGEVDRESFEEICRFGFTEMLDIQELKDEEGNELLSLDRSIDDLKSDLSEENIARIEALDNDDYTADLTYRLMGKKLDFSAISNPRSDVYMNEIDDFSVYENEELVLFYIYLRDNSETEKVEFINDLIAMDPDVNYIAVLVEGLESSSAALRNMKIRFNCPVVSVLGRMPDDFFGFGLVNYPTAVFVEKGTFSGAYSNIADKEKFAEAIGVFLKDGCIAYRRNNHKSKG